MPVNPVYNLSASEQQVFNNLSQAVNYATFLGNRFQDTLQLIEGQTVKEGTPVNALAAAQTLNIDGVVIHGETVTIDNPEVDGTDVYEFLADVAQVKSLPTNKAVDINAVSTKATINLTLAVQPTSGDKITIGTKVFTFVPVGTDTADGEVSIGADLPEAKVNLVAAINGTDGISESHPLVIAAEFNANVSAITALIGGVAGDAIATTSAFTNGGNLFAGATLAGGVDCLAPAAVTALALAITTFDTQGVGGVDGTNDTVVLTADTKGAAGNDIIVGETMANGVFDLAATQLIGGADGTIGVAGAQMVDATFLYTTIAENTTAGANWRRIAVGNVF